MKKLLKKNCLLLALGAAIVVFISCVESIKLNKTTLGLAVGESETLLVTATPVNFAVPVKWISDNAAVAVDSTGKVTAMSTGTAVITAKAGNKTATCTIAVGVRINGVIWATCNVDAPNTFTDTPQEHGKYYMWNVKHGYDWDTKIDPVKYDHDSPPGSTWQKENDPCPAGWRVPTAEEQQSLFVSDSKWTTTPANGRIFGNDENTIFLPAAGYGTGDLNHPDPNQSWYGKDGRVTYWNSASNKDSIVYAQGMWFSIHNDIGYSEKGMRFYKYSVRCVAE